MLHLVLATPGGEIEDDLERLVHDLGTLVILHEMEGFDHYFLKPVDPCVLSDLLKNHAAGSTSAAG